MESEKSGSESNIHRRTIPSTHSSENELFISENKPRLSHDRYHDPIHFMPNATITTTTPHSENENSTFLRTNDQTNSSMMEKDDGSSIHNHLEANHANPFGEFHHHYPHNSNSSFSSSQNPFLVFGDHYDANESQKLHDHAPFEPNFHQPSSYESSSSSGNPFHELTSTANDSHKIVEYHDHDNDWHHEDHWNFPNDEETTHASSSNQLLDPLFRLESTQNQQVDNATHKNHKGFESSTQQNMHDSHFTGFESSTSQHMHNSLSASSNTEKDTYVHPKPQNDILSDSESSDDDMLVRSMPKHEQKSSTQQNMHDSHSTGVESSTSQHTHNSLSASSNTEKDTHVHPKPRKDIMLASESSDDDMLVRPMTKHEQKSSAQQNIQDSHFTGFESSTQQHKHDSPSASSNTEKNAHVHQISGKDNRLPSESSDDDMPVRSMPKHEQKSSTPVAVPETIQNPPIQIMERQENSPATPSSTPRIPFHVIAKDKLNAQWSNASNESLFSIQMGNTSFSNDMAWLNKSGEFDKHVDHMNNMPSGLQSNHSPLLPQTQNTKFNDISPNFDEQRQSSLKVTEQKAAETMREVIMETSDTPENNKSKGSMMFSNAAIHSNTNSSSNNDHSRHSNGSTQSFAFKSYADGDKTLSAKHGEETKKQLKQSGQQNVEATVTETAPSAAQNTKPTSNASENRWLSCFTCCH